MEIFKNMGWKDFLNILLTLVIILSFFKHCKDKETQGLKKLNQVTYVKMDKPFKPDKPYNTEEPPRLVEQWKDDEPIKSKNYIVVNDTTRNIIIINDTIRNITEEFSLSYLLNHLNSKKLLQLDLDYKDLKLTLQDRENHINTYTYGIDVSNYKYRYTIDGGLTKKLTPLSMSHFEDYMIINHDLFTNTTNLSNRLQYKTGRIIIEGRLGIDYLHDNQKFKFRGELGGGYRIF